jgi:hypothetical protein
MPDEPEVPEIDEDSVKSTLFVPETNIELTEEGGLRILLDEAALSELGELLDQNSGGSPGCISKPGWPSC